jgi:ABC-2 type transport system ATP-binding protein
MALELRGLTRSYGARTAVKDLTVAVQVGDVYGFLGPNGAGKTTAIRCVLGLIRPDAGEIRIFGDRVHPRCLGPVGAIVEAPAFHTWLSGTENLRNAAAYGGLSGKQAANEIARVLDRVGLVERARDNVGDYSLGMRQRLAIARALLRKPKLLLLDEPTNGLDPRGMRDVRDLVRSLALHDQITVFISSHLLGEVQAICNRVGILQEGHMRAEGNVHELLTAQASGRSIVEVGVTDPAVLEDALKHIDGAVMTGPGAAGRCRVELNGLDIPALNAALVAAEVPVQALVPEQRNLEDVFLEVTR